MFSIEEELSRSRDSNSHKIAQASRIVCYSMPYLAGLFEKVSIRIDDRCDKACIFPSGTMLVHSRLIANLDSIELGFVFAHEIMHLFLKSENRILCGRNRRLYNYAHDFIINDILSEAFANRTKGEETKMLPPAGGLYWPDYRSDFIARLPGTSWKVCSEYSLEELCHLLCIIQRSLSAPLSDEPVGQNQLKQSISCIGVGPVVKKGKSVNQTKSFLQKENSYRERTFQDLFEQEGDLFSEEVELDFFSNETTETLCSKRNEILRAVDRAESQARIMDLFSRQNFFNDSFRESKGLSRRFCRDFQDESPAWKEMLQSWLDVSAPPHRSWMRPSRRNSLRHTNIVLPGRDRAGWTLHLVLDTSGSMETDLPNVLGTIGAFFESNEVEQIRIIQIDSCIRSDEFIEVSDLYEYPIFGLGNNDMNPAWELLANDPYIESVVVITDGYIEIPPEPPFFVLWTLPRRNPKFNPQYGTVVYLDLP